MDAPTRFKAGGKGSESVRAAVSMLSKAVLVLLVLSVPTVLALDMSKAGSAEFPKPFTRKLVLLPKPLTGSDVVILQNLLLRSSYVVDIRKSGFYDRNTAEAVANFQEGHKLPGTGIFDVITATLVLENLMYDGYKDDGKVPVGYKFKVHVPVYKDRTIETTATLFDANNEPVYMFVARCHGAMDPKTGKAFNQLSHNGNTPTGLVTFDLNTPEPDRKAFGKFPVIRAVKGLKGNAAIGLNANNTFLSDYRSGILLHTGEWSNWNATMPMPNSDGCIHVHQTDLSKIDDILVNRLGVTVNPNTFGKKPYPYTPQGILSVQQID